MKQCALIVVVLSFIRFVDKVSKRDEGNRFYMYIDFKHCYFMLSRLICLYDVICLNLHIEFMHCVNEIMSSIILQCINNKYICRYGPEIGMAYASHICTY